MRIKVDKICDFLVHIFTITLIASITIFTTFSWGKYIFLFCIIGVCCLNVAKNNGKFILKTSKYFFHLLAFALYALISSVWAYNSNDSISKGITLLEILIMIVVIYSYYKEKDQGTSNFLMDIKISSVIIVCYTFLYYGIGDLLLLAKFQDRMINSYANVNTIGIIAALGTFMQLDDIIKNKRISIFNLSCIPSILLISLTQSRKALLMLVLGCGLVLVLRNSTKKKTVKSLFKKIIWIVLGLIALYYLFKLPIFSGVLYRMEQLINSYIGIGNVDNSTQIRHRMMDLGFQQFLKTPILGMGIGNAYHLVITDIGESAYLHNNFIELLASGGIIGFVIYYSMYFYLFSNLYRYRDLKDQQYIIVFVTLIVLFIMDYGRVTYYTKTQYLYLILGYLEIEELKGKHKFYKGIKEDVT